MEDCCAVCAEPLEYIAYGPCGHREVCSTCTARLRLVLGDKRCCICKQDCSHVFVTRDLGKYTNLIADFSSLIRKDSAFLFERSVQAYFDSQEEFKRIKSLCKLQCKVCEANQGTNHKGFVKAGFVFKNMGLLRQHLSLVHKLTMCELCLEGRKVFVIEQTLYTSGQLEAHCSKGDWRVGFKGHPKCEFCQKRFYGDNELYHHMSTEHFTCHFCQKDKPDQYDYFQAYDDLEAHFRNDHILCEDAECLAKKFVVFRSEADFKIHNAKEHGDKLSRSERTAALKVPVSLQVRRDDIVLSTASSLVRPPATSDPSAFPTLPGTSRRHKHRNRAKRVNATSSSEGTARETRVIQDGNENAGSSAPAPAPAPAESSSASSNFPAISLTVDEIRAATKLLLQQIRIDLDDDEEKIAEFKTAQAGFKNGALTCVDYYERIAKLGLLNIVPKLAWLCPDPQKRQELYLVHSSHSTGDKTSLPADCGTSGCVPSKGKTKVVTEKRPSSGASASASSTASFVAEEKPAKPIANTVTRGAWKNGGGMRLLAQAQRESIMFAAHSKPGK